MKIILSQKFVDTGHGTIDYTSIAHPWEVGSEGRIPKESVLWMVEFQEWYCSMLYGNAPLDVTNVLVKSVFELSAHDPNNYILHDELHDEMNSQRPEEEQVEMSCDNRIFSGRFDGTNLTLTKYLSLENPVDKRIINRILYELKNEGIDPTYIILNGQRISVGSW